MRYPSLTKLCKKYSQLTFNEPHYYVVPNSRACTAIYLGGNVALHGLITHCTLIHFRKCGLHVFYLDHFL